MAERSKKIEFFDREKLTKINLETIKLWNKYKIDMSIRELSPKTIAGYENDLQQWWIYIYDNQDNKSILEIKEDDITEFLFYCKSNGNNSRRMKRRMASISAFYKYLRKKRIVVESPMEFIDRPRKDTNVVVQTYLTSEQVQMIQNKLDDKIESVDNLLQKHYYFQLKCYAMFALSTMARVNALSNVQWKQIDLENRIVADVVEKEGYVVELYFSKEVKDLLIQLQNMRKEININDNGWLFVGNSNGSYSQMKNSSLNQWCKVIGNLIGVDTLHDHDFRHSGATLLKDNGMQLEEVSKLLHHASTDVTSKFYIKYNEGQLRENKDKYEI